MEEFGRYARQIALADIGEEGQKKLSQASVMVAGLGGLGSLVAQQLAAMGIGKLKLVDRDIVTLTDLHRQYLYSEDDVGKLKVEAAIDRLKKLNSDVIYCGEDVTVTEEMADLLIKDVDVVIDGMDSMWARYALNYSCIRAGKPYVYGAAVGMHGVASTIIPGKTACLRCIYPSAQDESLLSCSIVGVHPSVLGVISSIQVSEAAKLVMGKEPSLLSKVLFFELSDMRFETFHVKRNPSCQDCGSFGKREHIITPLLERSCSRDGKGTYFVNPSVEPGIDINSIARNIKRRKEGSDLQLVKEDESIGLKLYVRKSDLGGIALVDLPARDIEEVEERIIVHYREAIRSLASLQRPE